MRRSGGQQLLRDIAQLNIEKVRLDAENAQLQRASSRRLSEADQKSVQKVLGEQQAALQKVGALTLQMLKPKAERVPADIVNLTAQKLELEIRRSALKERERRGKEIQGAG
ncbi:MAG: hypothetical protein U5N53_06100 [Mycobacterium sp.]|nr:hypothetical protein [Mycobacterium sp.]